MSIENAKREIDLKRYEELRNLAERPIGDTINFFLGGVSLLDLHVIADFAKANVPPRDDVLGAVAMYATEHRTSLFVTADGYPDETLRDKVDSFLDATKAACDSTLPHEETALTDK